MTHDEFRQAVREQVKCWHEGVRDDDHLARTLTHLAQRVWPLPARFSPGDLCPGETLTRLITPKVERDIDLWGAATAGKPWEAIADGIVGAVQDLIKLARDRQAGRSLLPGVFFGVNAFIAQLYAFVIVVEPSAEATLPIPPLAAADAPPGRTAERGRAFDRWAVADAVAAAVRHPGGRSVVDAAAAAFAAAWPRLVAEVAARNVRAEEIVSPYYFVPPDAADFAAGVGRAVASIMADLCGAADADPSFQTARPCLRGETDGGRLRLSGSVCRWRPLEAQA